MSRIPRVRLWVLAVTACLAAYSNSVLPQEPSPFERAEAALRQGAYVDALKILRGVQNDSSEGVRCDALIGLGQLYIALTELNKAKDYLEQARELADRLGTPGPRARILVMQARLDLLQTRYRRASERLQQAHDLALQATDTAVQLEVLRWRAELQQRQGDSISSERSIAAGLAMAAAGKDRGALAFAVAQQAAYHARRANYRPALELWQQVLGQFRSLGYVPSEAQAILSLGELYYELGLINDAVQMLSDALRRYRTLADPVGEVRALIRLGSAHLRLKEPEKALNYAESALTTARKRHDYIGEGEALVQIGELWLEHKVPGRVLMPDPGIALKHLKSAMEIYRDAGDRYAESRTYLKVGAAYLAANQPRVAARVFEEVRKGALQTGDEETLWQALRGEGRAFAMVNEFSEAAKRYSEAVEILERAYQRTAGLGQEARSAFLGDRRGLFEEYIDVLMHSEPSAAGQNLMKIAFGISELARSRQFSEMLAGAGAERAAGREGSHLRKMIESERNLQNDYSQVTKSLASLGGGGAREELAQLQARQQSLRTALDEIQSEIAKTFPRFAELSKPRRFTVADIQTVLAPDETLLSYFVMRGQSVVFVLDRKSFRAVPLALGRGMVRQLVDRFRRPFTEMQGAVDLNRWRPETAAELYEKLAADVAPLLPKHGHLIIAGDDALYTLPFEALLVGNSKIAPSGGGPIFREYATLPWFGDRYSIGYVPSAGALLTMRREGRAGAWKQSFIAFADPDFGSDSATEDTLATKGGLYGAMLARSTGVKGIPRLPETADEAAAVNKVLGGKGQLFLRSRASESQVYETNLIGTRYLMFSTHGLLGGDFSSLGQPALAMSLVNNPEGIDGFLTMSEVLGLRLDADVTVLSACNTAGEPENARGGEGFAGLTRSFMYAGTRSLVVSHWPVGSRATVALMTEFFRELAAGRSKPLALANARRKVRQMVQQGVQLAHPFFWAPFVLVGDPL
ncbi:MAG: CHAT domain-containing protein [Rhodocyclales bacterium]|nr:CHAT domain-containing protein [Rhodocyclales bacterium]